MSDPALFLRQTAIIIIGLGLALALIAAAGWQPARIGPPVPPATCGHDCWMYP